MKKVFITLMSIALLFSACGSDDNQDAIPEGKGALVATINFEGITKAAPLSNAIPKTGWDNVKMVQMFLYDKTTGAVAFSDVIYPETSETVFKWTNVPEGTYELALVANINSASNIAASLNGGTTFPGFDQYNVIGKKINSEIYFDLKKTTFPASHSWEVGDVAYNPTSEVFTAYKSAVDIIEGQTTDLTAGGTVKLQLKREISMFRVRVDKRNKPGTAPALSTVDFANANNFIAIHNMPKGLGLKFGAFEGGIYDNATAADKNRIMIGSTGLDTYNTANPSATDYDPTTIIDANFALWKDIQVWPNASRAEGIATDGDATSARKYFIVISGWAPIGYEYADGSKNDTSAQPVYWSGTINGVFSPNVIREVNITINSKGLPENPENPDKTGGLTIEVGEPQKWSHIERTDVIF